jgi:hypothetical protein
VAFYDGRVRPKHFILIGFPKYCGKIFWASLLQSNGGQHPQARQIPYALPCSKGGFGTFYTDGNKPLKLLIFILGAAKFLRGLCVYIFLIMKNDRKYLQEFDFQYVRSSSMLRNTHACLYIKKKGGWMDGWMYIYIGIKNGLAI